MFLTRFWRAALLALVLALPATAAFAAQRTHTAPLQPRYVECATTSETDNVQVNGNHNPFNDDLGNQWVVYYDLKRDCLSKHTNVLIAVNTSAHRTGSPVCGTQPEKRTARGC